MATETVAVDATTEAIKYGVVGILCLVFAIVIIYLYKEGKLERKSFETERKEWDKERGTLRAQIAVEQEKCRTEQEKCRTECATKEKMFEVQHRTVVESYANQMNQLRQTQEKREDDIRRETHIMLEKLSDKYDSSSKSLVDMLQKFYDQVIRD